MDKSKGQLSLRSKTAAPSPVAATKGWSHPALVGLLLAAVTLAVYWRATGFEFINYDDPDYFSENPHIQSGLTRNGVAWAFHFGGFRFWHPLTWLSLMLDAELFGTGPGGPHFTNILLHAANVVLLFLWLRWLTGAQWRSVFVAALFALHPLHVEPVAWISSRKDVLSTCFGLLSLIFYARYAQRAGARSKEQGATGLTRYFLLLTSCRFCFSRAAYSARRCW